MSSGGLSFSGIPFARLQEAWASPFPGNLLSQPSSPRYSSVPAPFKPPGSPPPHPPPFSSLSHPHQSWWAAELECSGEYYLNHCPPYRPWPTARSLPVPRGVVSPVSGFLSSSAMIPPRLLLCCPISWCLLVVCLFLGSLLHAYKRLGLLHSLAISCPSPHPRATRPCQRRSSRPDPPPLTPPPFPLYPIPISLGGPRS